MDEITDEYIRSTEDLLWLLYVKLFSKILDTGVFPSEWSTGVKIPLHKNKGDHTDMNNYRGITVLVCMVKLFTSILNEHLYQHSEVNCLLNETQAGFWHEYLTLDHVFLLTCIVDLFVYL